MDLRCCFTFIFGTIHFRIWPNGTNPLFGIAIGWTFAANCACIHQSGGGAFDPEFGRTTCSGKMEADRRDVLCPFYLPTPATNCLRFPFRFLRSETRARKEECVRNALLTSSGDVAPRARARVCVVFMVVAQHVRAHARPLIERQHRFFVLSCRATNGGQNRIAIRCKSWSQRVIESIWKFGNSILKCAIRDLIRSNYRDPIWGTERFVVCARCSKLYYDR